jgi:hypothetical protein
MNTELPPGAGGIIQETIAEGLLSVGPGASPPTLPVPTTTAAAVGVWGFVGPIIEMPDQTSSPPISCGVYGQGGVIGSNGYTGTISNPDPNGDGVIGFGGSNGVHGLSVTGTGTGGTSTSGAGVAGFSTSGYGVMGTSTSDVGVMGTCNGATYGVYGTCDKGVGVRGDTVDGNAGVVGVSTGKGLAGQFNGAVAINGTTTIGGTAQVNGNVSVSGNITSTGTITATTDVIITGGSDCAEHFDTSDEASAQPGTILVIDDDGSLRQSERAYDKRVAGVVSGAGEYRPAIVLDRKESARSRVPVALVGKVYCKADADYGPIGVGDLLTTSDRPGFAMKAGDPSKAFGAVIGKALHPLSAGQGLIPILVALQ